jgi:acid phosphatase
MPKYDRNGLNRNRTPIIFRLALIASLVMLTVFQTNLLALSGNSIPNLTMVREMIVEYRKCDIWHIELEDAASRAIQILDGSGMEVKKRAVVFDIDETTLDNYEYYENNGFCYFKDRWSEWVDSAKAPRIEPIFRVYRHALDKGYRIFFITGRHERSRASTERNLKNAGYSIYESLIMRDQTNAHDTALVYKSRAREKLTRKGYKIILNVGDQYSDLLGGYSKHILKLPNPMYFIP